MIMYGHVPFLFFPLIFFFFLPFFAAGAFDSVFHWLQEPIITDYTLVDFGLFLVTLESPFCISSHDAAEFASTRAMTAFGFVAMVTLLFMWPVF